MNDDATLLEERVQSLLGWSIEKIARSRQIDLRRALDDYYDHGGRESKYDEAPQQQPTPPLPQPTQPPPQPSPPPTLSQPPKPQPTSHVETIIYLKDLERIHQPVITVTQQPKVHNLITSHNTTTIPTVTLTNGQHQGSVETFFSNPKNNTVQQITAYFAYLQQRIINQKERLASKVQFQAQYGATLDLQDKLIIENAIVQSKSRVQTAEENLEQLTSILKASIERKSTLLSLIEEDADQAAKQQLEQCINLINNILS
jgi:hypothetical protein